jgi:hypothetical protein
MSTESGADFFALIIAALIVAFESIKNGTVYILEAVVGSVPLVV